MLRLKATVSGSHLDHMLVQFEQIVWSKLREILSFLTKKNEFFKTILDNARVDAIL